MLAFAHSEKTDSKENSTDQQESNQTNAVNIPVCKLFPVAEIYLIVVFGRAKQGGYHMIGAIEHRSAERSANSGLEKGIEPECADERTKNHGSKSIGSHQSCGTKGKGLKVNPKEMTNL